MYYIYYLLFTATLYALSVTGGRAGRLFLSAGLLIHVSFTAHRTIILGDMPVTERLDVLSLMGLATMALYLLTKRKRSIKNIEYYMIALSCFFVLSAVFYSPIDSVSQFMRTPWFYLHSLLNVLSYAMLGLGAALGVVFITGGDEAMERLQYRHTLYGWIAFSLSLLTGSIWFFLAYGSYWYWTSKELWASLTWFYYGIYLHARLLGGLKGRPAALIGALCYPLLLFSYFGIGTVIKSPWTQF